MRLLLTATLVIGAGLMQSNDPGSARVLNLRVPHPPRADETALIEVVVGAIERGTEIDVKTASNRSLGTISPFGIRSGNRAGTYTLPIPVDAIKRDQVSLRISVSQYGHSERAPTEKEVLSVRVKLQAPAR